MNTEEADRVLAEGLAAAATRLTELAQENEGLRRQRSVLEERDRTRQDDSQVYRDQRDTLRRQLAELKVKLNTYEAAIACVTVLARTWRDQAANTVASSLVEGFARQVEAALRGEDHTLACACGHYVLAHDHSGCAWCSCKRGHGLVVAEAIGATGDKAAAAVSEAEARLQRVMTYLQALTSLSGVERRVLDIARGSEGVAS